LDEKETSLSQRPYFRQHQPPCSRNRLFRDSRQTIEQGNLRILDVFLESPGDNIAVGLNIGEQIRAHDLPTTAGYECASVCGRMWLAGRDGTFFENSQGPHNSPHPTPAARLATDTLNNRDFAGRRIIEPAAPIPTKLKQAAEHVAVSPYSTFSSTTLPKSSKGAWYGELRNQLLDIKAPTLAQQKGEKYCQ